MSSFEKSVKGGTKVKLAPPKSKYVEHILLGTNTGEAGVGEVFRTLTHRLRDSTWTVAFKSLIIVHLMVKEGAPDTTLRYLSTAPKTRLAVNHFTDVQTQGQNIRRYQDYLVARALAYAVTSCDYVRAVADGRMKRLTVDKGLLRETEVVQDQITALVRCDFFSHDAENEISLTAFRLLTRDLLDLFSVENEAVMNVLSHYFEMSKPDAERAINIYKTFCKQTDQVVQYLQVAREYEHATRLEVPKLKHAPTSLVNSLQEYLDDQDFDVNRRQYLAEQEAKKKVGKPFRKARTQTSQAAPATSSSPTPVSAATAARAEAVMAPQQAKGPAPDLIDFFESIEQNQQPMVQAASNPFLPQQQPQQQAAFPHAQMTGYPGQQSQQEQQQAFAFQQPQPTGANGFSAALTNPFGQVQQQQAPPPPLQTQLTGAGFGGSGPQTQQQQHYATGNAFAQPQQQFASPVAMQPPPQMQSPPALQPQQTGSTNPFRQSMMMTASSGGFDSFFQPQQQQQPPQQQDPQRQTTNPFAKPHHQQMPAISESQPFSSQPLVSQPTGTNPFARPSQPQPQQQPQQQPTPPMSPPNALQVQATGSTNPFRQSAFVNPTTGLGWQSAPQATMGGLERLETVEVFPRPGQAQGRGGPWGS